jgi:hypothetical protein
MDDGLSGAVELIVYGVPLLAALVCVAKTKFWVALCFIPPLSPLVVAGAIRLAKPHSPWAKRFYSREKMQQAVERFPDEAEGVELDPEARERGPLTPWLAGLAIAVAAAIGAQQGL